MIARSNRRGNVNWRVIGIAAATLAVIAAIVAGLIFFVGTGAKAPASTSPSSTESTVPSIANGTDPVESSASGSEGSETVATESVSGTLPTETSTDDTLPPDVKKILDDDTPLDPDNLDTRFPSNPDLQGDVDKVVAQVTAYNIYQFNNLLCAAQEVASTNDYKYISSFYKDFADADWYWEYAPTNYTYSDGNYFTKFESAMYYGYYVKKHLADGKIFCIDMFKDMGNYTSKTLPTNSIGLGTSGVTACEEYPGVGLMYCVFQLYGNSTDFANHTFVYGVPSSNIKSYDKWYTGSIKPAYVVPVKDQNTGKTFGILFDSDNNLIGLMG